MSCIKISRHLQLNAWRMKLTTVQETFSCKTIFFKIDQLIADNPNSSKQTFSLSQITITREKKTEDEKTEDEDGPLTSRSRTTKSTLDLE